MSVSAKTWIKRIKKGNVLTATAQPEKSVYCKHLHWLTFNEGSGDYWCELDLKTSSEYCEKKGRCKSYEGA